MKRLSATEALRHKWIKSNAQEEVWIDMLFIFRSLWMTHFPRPPFSSAAAAVVVVVVVDDDDDDDDVAALWCVGYGVGIPRSQRAFPQGCSRRVSGPPQLHNSCNGQQQGAALRPTS